MNSVSAGLYIGLRSGSEGNLNITSGSTLSCSACFIGNEPGSTGEVTVSGSSTTWTCGACIIGDSGTGTLNISGGATFTPISTYVGYDTSSTGTINFGTGGTLTTKVLYASPTQLKGTGTINTNSMISDIVLVFDLSHGLIQTITLNSQPNQNITVNLDMSGAPDYNTELGAGWKGNGSLTIRDGITVNSDTGIIGFMSDSTGVATVDGPGSTWNNNVTVVGLVGNGTLNITGGGTVSNHYGYIGCDNGSSGTVTVDGPGSTWSNSDDLFVGELGSGTLNITGGTVTSDTSFISFSYSDSSGVVTVDGSTSTWNSGDLFLGCFGTGSVTQNSGTVSIDGTLYFSYYDSASIGTYNLNGGTLIIKSINKGSGTATFNFGGGTLQPSDAFSTSLPMILTGDSGNANVDTSGHDVTLSGILSGIGGINKLGTGTLTLSALETYSGDTTVSDGTLVFAGGIDAGGTMLIDVQSGTAVFSTTDIGRSDLDIITAAGATFEIAEGTHVVGEISGGGMTRVDSGASLTAASITQGTLIIGGTGAGSGAVAVPEPAVWVMLGGVFVVLAVCGRGKGRRV
ncbi:MAG: autotransporter-associated beta strand repeat-containing protein [Pirellulales bacterium]|nr:autotransporter-associated beta strand repeat-containing protein [Pirellulales bacterium]